MSAFCEPLKMDNLVFKIIFVFLTIISLTTCQLTSDSPSSSEFTPGVSATCRAGYMTIRVQFNQSFTGAVHARDFRTPACMTHGDGGRQIQLTINLLAQPGQPDYCGVLVINKTEERSIPVAVRIHRTLELADDKSYVITCGKAGFKNARNETSLVSLRVLDENGRRVQEAVYSRSYKLRAEISRPDGTYGIRIKSCYAFSKLNSSVLLIDDRGCPVQPAILGQFSYEQALGRAEADLHSMFRFPGSGELHFQCDVAVCTRGRCPEPQCDDDQALGRSLATPVTDDGVLIASTSVFVLEPGEQPLVSPVCEDGTVRPAWLLWLCVALGILFLIMLVINVFLCSAMTCACARTDIIDKEPSIIEDYDPYRSWHGSQYGSRYSLNGAGAAGNGNKPHKGYASGGSTMNSTRSVSSHSDHYAIVHSRPGSRYDPGPPRRGPPSNIGSHYSAK